MRSVAGKARLRRICALAAFVVLSASDARAYRPFDGTDADVADVGTLELELGPTQYYRRANSGYLVAPATVLNFGFAPNLEAVVDFKDFISEERVSGVARVRLLETDALLKWGLRRGALQGEGGASIALEAGPLLPELGGESRFGIQANLIVSHRGRLGAVHMNAQTARSRTGNLDLFGSVILEGPEALVIRPVTEIFVEREFGETSRYSALVGAIWSARESLSVDAGVRLAREGDDRALEVRFGFTSAWELWSSRERKIAGRFRKGIPPSHPL